MRRYAIAVLALLTALPLTAAVQVVGPHPWHFAHPGAPHTFVVDYFNNSQTDHDTAVIRIELPETAVLRSVPEGCTANGRVLTCTFPAAPVSKGTLHVPILMPADFSGATKLDIRLTSGSYDQTHTVPMFRTFVVDNTADSGPGSLRQAILDANAAGCRPDARCSITFRFAAPPENGWYTIQPLSELPVLTGEWTGIDASIQTFLTGDTNPAGPEIELNGARAGHANGLVVANVGELEIRGLAINDFAANGIEFRGEGPLTFSLMSFRVVRDNYIGVDPTGTRAAGNGMRGISVFGWGAKMVNNVISGNGMSGVFWWGKGGQFMNDDDYGLQGNRIGVKAASDDPIPNGASGVFFGPEAKGIDLADNVIAHNKHMGVAMASVTENALTRNRIWGNGGRPIDLGLNGKSELFGPQFDEIRLPILDRATYDPVTNRTTVEGRIEPYGGYGYYLELYRGGEMRHFVQRTDFLTQYSFSVSVPGDLRGQLVAATVTRRQYHGWLRGPGADANWQGFESQTSELSDPIVVQ